MAAIHRRMLGRHSRQYPISSLFMFCHIVMPPHSEAAVCSNTPRHAAQARADLSAGRSAPRTQGKFAAFDEFCKRLIGIARRPQVSTPSLDLTSVRRKRC